MTSHALGATVTSEDIGTRFSTTGYNGTSYTAQASEDGRYYITTAIVGYGPIREQAYLVDRQTKTSEYIGYALDGTSYEGNSSVGSGASSISGDGRYITYEVGVPPTTPCYPWMQPCTSERDFLHLYDRVAHTVSLIKVNGQPNRGTPFGVLSADGRYVVFGANPTPTSPYELYLLDRNTGATELISKHDGPDAPFSPIGGQPDITSDGNLIAFNALGTDENGGYNRPSIFVYNRSTAITTRVTGPTEFAYAPSITDDGNKVAYWDSSDNPGGMKVKLYDMQTHQTLSWPVGTHTALISSDGSSIAMHGPNGGVFYESPIGSQPLTIRGDQYSNVDWMNSDGTILTTDGGNYDLDKMSFITKASDSTPPSVTGSTNQMPSQTGWYNSDVTITWTATDESGTATTPPPTLANIEGEHTYVSEPSCDGANNCATGTLTLKLDKSAPSISYSVSPRPNSTGWNSSDVTVTFACTDTVSGIASCPSPVSVSSETAGQAITGTTLDNAGNQASITVDIKVDKQGPVISNPTWSNNPLLQGQNTQLNVTATDNLSGVAGVAYSLNGSVPSPMTLNSVTGQWVASFGANLPVDTYTVTFTAYDNAGNTSTGPSDILAIYNPTNGYITGHAKITPSATDVLPITLDTSANNPARLVVGFTNVTAPTSGSFDVSYVIKQNRDEFSLSSTGINWVVVPDSTHATIFGKAILTKYVAGAKTVQTDMQVKIEVTLGSGSQSDHVAIKVYQPNDNTSTAAPSYVVDEFVIQNGSQLIIHH